MDSHPTKSFCFLYESILPRNLFFFPTFRRICVPHTLVTRLRLSPDYAFLLCRRILGVVYFRYQATFIFRSTLFHTFRRILCLPYFGYQATFIPGLRFSALSTYFMSFTFWLPAYVYPKNYAFPHFFGVFYAYYTLLTKLRFSPKLRFSTIFLTYFMLPILCLPNYALSQNYAFPHFFDVLYAFRTLATKLRFYPKLRYSTFSDVIYVFHTLFTKLRFFPTLRFSHIFCRIFLPPILDYAVTLFPAFKRTCAVVFCPLRFTSSLFIFALYHCCDSLIVLYPYGRDCYHYMLRCGGHDFFTPYYFYSDLLLGIT